MQYINLPSLFLPYILCLLLPFLSKKIDEQQARIASNLTLCILSLGFVLLAAFDVYITYLEGYLYDQIAFYKRATGSHIRWFLLVLAPIFIGIIIQLLWIKSFQTNKFLSRIIAIYLTAYFLTSKFLYIEYIDHSFLPTSLPSTPSLFSVFFHSLPTLVSYLIIFSWLYYNKSKK